MVCLSVYHVRALCSNGRRYRHDFSCIRQPDVSLRSPLNFADISLTPPSKILAQSDPPPVDLSVEDIRWQIAAEWLEMAQCNNGEPIGNHNRSFEWYHR